MIISHLTTNFESKHNMTNFHLNPLWVLFGLELVVPLAISPPPMIVLPPLVILLGLNFWAPPHQS
jgi:hypothetical protein